MLCRGYLLDAGEAIEAHPAPGERGGPRLQAVPGQQTDPTPYRVREGGWRESRGPAIGTTASITAGRRRSPRLRSMHEASAGLPPPALFRMHSSSPRTSPTEI